MYCDSLSGKELKKCKKVEKYIDPNSPDTRYQDIYIFDDDISSQLLDGGLIFSEFDNKIQAFLDPIKLNYMPTGNVLQILSGDYMEYFTPKTERENNDKRRFLYDKDKNVIGFSLASHIRATKSKPVKWGASRKIIEEVEINIKDKKYQDYRDYGPIMGLFTSSIPKDFSFPLMTNDILYFDDDDGTEIKNKQKYIIVHVETISTSIWSIKREILKRCYCISFDIYIKCLQKYYGLKKELITLKQQPDEYLEEHVLSSSKTTSINLDEYKVKQINFNSTDSPDDGNLFGKYIQGLERNELTSAEFGRKKSSRKRGRRKAKSSPKGKPKGKPMPKATKKRKNKKRKTK